MINNQEIIKKYWLDEEGYPFSSFDLQIGNILVTKQSIKMLISEIYRRKFYHYYGDEIYNDFLYLQIVKRKYDGFDDEEFEAGCNYYTIVKLFNLRG